ncbi:F-box protein At3g07870-like [Cornus florida]|uniref:F-box protein At3g07870-like n=1 Tax=Cornus florida TaxID=4283 RepID=UPI00289B9AE2|nr:F-box protein At3g07870-like [Cornus florida]
MMNRLTDDLVTDILSRLPIKTLTRCTCVCKLWRNIARDPRFIHSQLNSRSSQQNPSFILCTTLWFDSAFRSQIYFLEHNETLGYTCEKVSFSIPDLKEFRSISSCNGLLCLVDRMNRDPIYICNPFTRCCTKLPIRIDPPQNIGGLVMGFGFNPTRNEYKLVEIINSSGPFMVSESTVYVYTLGDGFWRNKGNVPYVILSQQLALASSEAFLCGALHWLCLFPAKHIASFDIANELFGVIPYPEMVVDGGGGLSLVVLGGCLSIMDSSFHEHIDLWIMKDYGVKESWVKSFSIRFHLVGWDIIKYVRTLCVQGNGELLMLHNNQALLSYSPRAMTLRKLRIAGLPSWFEMVNHVGSLVSL